SRHRCTSTGTCRAGVVICVIAFLAGRSLGGSLGRSVGGSLDRSGSAGGAVPVVGGWGAGGGKWSGPGGGKWRTTSCFLSPSSDLDSPRLLWRRGSASETAVRDQVGRGQNPGITSSLMSAKACSLAAR